MICRECNKEVLVINKQHLSKCSNITREEYIKKYPNTSLIEENIRLSYASHGNKNGNWKNGKSIKNCIECDKQLSRNNQSGLCRSCANTGSRNGFFNKQHSVKTKKQMCQSAKKRDKTTYKYGLPLKEDISANNKKRWEQKTDNEKQEAVKNFIIAGLKSCKKSKETKIENLIFDFVNSFNVSVERNFQIGIYNVDFLIKNKFIVECFGDYWHCNPSIYEGNFYNKSIKLTAKEKWEKDKNKIQKLKDKGFEVLVLWESDIVSQTKNTHKKIISFLL
jgi:very-short-patch-repair endonuclease